MPEDVVRFYVEGTHPAEIRDKIASEMDVHKRMLNIRLKELEIKF